MAGYHVTSEETHGVIGLPHRVHGYTAPWHCLMQLQKPKGTKIIPAVGSALSSQKNHIVAAALRDAGCAWVFFADDDQVYAPDSLLRLLAHDVPIVSGLIPLRVTPYEPVVARITKGGFERFTSEEVAGWGEGLVQVPVTTGAFTVYRREVFTKVEYPWFTPSPAGADEDLRLCQRAAAVGLKSYVDCAVRVGHLVEMAVRCGTDGPEFEAI